MVERNIDLSDEQLGAYADDELDAITRARVERALAVDREARARLAAIRDVTMLVRAATRARVTDSGPAAMPPLSVPAYSARVRAPVRPAWLTWRIAASFLAGLGAMLIIMQLTQPGTSPASTWQRAALDFHDRYLRAVAAGTAIGLDHLEPSSSDFQREFANVVDFRPRIPDLSAHRYVPVGARLLTTPDGAVTYVVYEAPDGPIVGYSMVLSDAPAREELMSDTHKNILMTTWTDGRFEYGLSGQLPADALETIADTARRSLDADSQPRPQQL